MESHDPLSTGSGNDLFRINYRVMKGFSAILSKIKELVNAVWPMDLEDNPKSPRNRCLQAILIHITTGYYWKALPVNEEIKELIKGDGISQESLQSSSSSSSRMSSSPASRRSSSPSLQRSSSSSSSRMSSSQASRRSSSPSLQRSSSSSSLSSKSSYSLLSVPSTEHEFNTILELKEDRKGGFQIPQSTTMEAAVIGLSELIGYMVALEPTTGVEYFTDSKCTLGTIVKSGDDQHNYQIFLNQQGDVLLGAITRSVQNSQAEAFSHTLKHAENTSRRKKKKKSCKRELMDSIVAAMELSQQYMTRKLMGLIGAKTRTDISSLPASDLNVFMVESESFLGEQLVTLMRINFDDLPMSNVITPPPRDPVLCEISQMGNEESKLELQLDQDFKIHKVQRFGVGDNSFIEYPNKLGIDLMHYFQPSPINPSSLHDDVTLCRMAIFDHLRAILKYANEVMGKSYKDLDGKEMDKVIYWEDRQHDEGQQNRKSFRVDERSDLGKALLELENAVKERKDMPCRATWESNDKSYYFEMKDSYSPEGLAQIHMITDGETDVYPFMADRRGLTRLPRYSDVLARCQQFAKTIKITTEDEKCILSIACYLFYFQTDAPRSDHRLVVAEKSLPSVFEALKSSYTSRDHKYSEGAVGLDSTNMLVWQSTIPTMHSKLLKNAQDNPYWAISLPALERSCRIAALKEANSIQISELVLSLEVAGSGKGGDSVLHEDGDWDDDSFLEFEDEASDVNLCQRYLLEYLLKAWEHSLSNEMKGAALPSLKPMLLEYITAEMKDSSIWFKPVVDRSVYFITPSAIALRLLSTLVEDDAEKSWIVAETASDGSLLTGEFSLTHWHTSLTKSLASSTCSVEVRYPRARTFTLSLTSDFVIRETAGPEYTGRGSDRFMKYLFTRLGESYQQITVPSETPKEAPFVELCKLSLLRYMGAALNIYNEEKLLPAEAEPFDKAAWRALRTSTASEDGTVKLNIVDDGGIVSTSLTRLNELAMESVRECSIKRECNAYIQTYVFTSTPSGIVVLTTNRGSIELAKIRPTSFTTPSFTCHTRLRDTLVQKWRETIHIVNVYLFLRVVQKMQIEIGEGKWKSSDKREALVRKNTLSDFIMKTVGMAHDRASAIREEKARRNAGSNWVEENRGLCTMASAEPRKPGGTVPKYSLTLRSDLVILSIRSDDSVITELEFINPVWNRLGPHLSKIHPVLATEIDEVCRLTLCEYLIAFQMLQSPRKLPNITKSYEEARKARKEEIENDSVVFTLLPGVTLLGEALKGLAEMTAEMAS